MKIGLSLLLTLLAVGTAVAQRNDASRVQILRGGEILLANDTVGTVADLAALKTRLAAVFQAGSRHVIIEADESTKLIDVLHVLRSVRDLEARPLSLRLPGADGDVMVMIPVFRDPNEDVSSLKPNPLTLVVRLDAAHRLYLNGDFQKSKRALFARLRQLFRGREKMKAYRPGSNEIEATLFLKPYPDLSFSEVIDLLRALHRAGANPLGLQIDDLSTRYAASNDAAEQIVGPERQKSSDR